MDLLLLVIRIPMQHCIHGCFAYCHRNMRNSIFIEPCSFRILLCRLFNLVDALEGRV